MDVGLSLLMTSRWGTTANKLYVTVVHCRWLWCDCDGRWGTTVYDFDVTAMVVGAPLLMTLMWLRWLLGHHCCWLWHDCNGRWSTTADDFDVTAMVVGASLLKTWRDCHRRWVSTVDNVNVRVVVVGAPLLMTFEVTVVVVEASLLLISTWRWWSFGQYCWWPRRDCNSRFGTIADNSDMTVAVGDSTLFGLSTSSKLTV